MNHKRTFEPFEVELSRERADAKKKRAAANVRDADEAWTLHHAQAKAVEDKTARLRELRLASVAVATEAAANLPRTKRRARLRAVPG